MFNVTLLCHSSLFITELCVLYCTVYCVRQRECTLVYTEGRKRRERTLKLGWRGEELLCTSQLLCPGKKFRQGN